MQIGINEGVIIITLVLAFNNNLDQVKISGQRFGDNLAQIQNDLRDETTNYDAKIVQYQKGNITKNEILQISDRDIVLLNDILSKYNTLKLAYSFLPSLFLFIVSAKLQFYNE